MVRLSIAILRKVCCWICRWFFLWYRWIAGKVTSKIVVVSCTFFVFLQCTGQAVKIWHLTSPLVLPLMSHFEHDVIHKTGSAWRIAKSVRVWSLENVLFSCTGPRARNSLPSSLHELADTKTFKRQLKTFLLNKHTRQVYLCYLPTLILFIIGIPSATHSFIPSLKPSFSANPSHRRLSFSSSGLTTWIPQTVYCYFWADPFLLFSFSVLHFFVVGSVR